MTTSAFDDLNWARFDLWAIANNRGITVLAEEFREPCHQWLGRENYIVSTIDFEKGVGPAVVALGNLFRWEEEFGYVLRGDSRNLDALDDGFEFPFSDGHGHVLELLNAEVAQTEDPRWFGGLLDIASSYSIKELAIGHRFFAMLVLPRENRLQGVRFREDVITFARPGKAERNPFAS